MTVSGGRSLAPGYIVLIVAMVLVVVVGGVCFVRKRRQKITTQHTNTATDIPHNNPHIQNYPTRNIEETRFEEPALGEDNLSPPRYEEPVVQFEEDQVPSYDEVIANDHVYQKD